MVVLTATLGTERTARETSSQTDAKSLVLAAEAASPRLARVRSSEDGMFTASLHTAPQGCSRGGGAAQEDVRTLIAREDGLPGRNMLAGGPRRGAQGVTGFPPEVGSRPRAAIVGIFPQAQMCYAGMVERIMWRLGEG
mmetsp:Transcript_25726/g.45809  ORF Transcript_25726/g.45809 Transcript_25726/m.45809 type:complete len:138 (-) Transcript_25726:451-864(-)